MLSEGKKPPKKKKAVSRSKNGLHPISMAILIIAVLLVIAGIAYFWITLVDKAGHAIQIQSVSFQVSETKIYAQNIGKGELAIYSVEINGEHISVNSTNCIVASEKTVTLPEGLTAEITLNRSYQDKIHIKIICEDGTFYELDQKP
jgi:flagellar basal body-associated protein FliL